MKLSRINVRVIPNAKANKVSEEKDKLRVYVNAPATEGKANKVMIKVLADFFNVKRSNIRIIKGEKSKEKVIEVNK